jgi:GH24 family phage-related lysozyme (muramidase)
MKETDNSSLANYKAYQKYKGYALKMISKLEKIKATGKSKVTVSDIVTQSSVSSILIGLGDRFPELTTKLKNLLMYSFNHSDLVKLHQTGKMDLNRWEDQSLSENAEMSQSDITKIIDYSEKLQSMFDVNDNLEDWVKAKLNHACDYVATVRDYLKFYNEEKQNIDRLTEEVKNLEQKFNKEKLDTVVDGIQYALDVVGLEPTVGSFADGANVVISLLRSALEKETDEKKKHLLNAAISAVSIVPFGDLAKIIKLRVLRKPAVKLLRFIKNILKSKNPSYTDTLLEKWSNTYKKSINCSNPKGFSQKAHCKARRLRQMGKKTKSKPVREIYEAVVRHMLKEFDSSMAMGALKQLNSDAKELEQMLQPNSELEDWVKAKLNLAGEYLDDVYHHLDHFGPEGRKFDEVKVANDIEEGWKDWLAAGAIGLAATTGKVDADKVKQPSNPIVQTATKDSDPSLLNKKTSDYVGHWEGKKDTVYKDSAGLPTIGIGHYLNNSQEDRQLFKALFGDTVNYDKVLNGQQKITDDQIEKLFNMDVKIKEKLASKKISNFTSLPIYVKNAVINALYRGDIGPKTIGLMNSGDWANATKEYLNHKNAKSGPSQIQRRMKTNALAFAQYAKNKNEYITQSDYVIG